MSFPEFHKPGIPLIVLHRQLEKVFLEALNGIRLGLHRERPLHFGFIAIRYEISSGPAVASNPVIVDQINKVYGWKEKQEKLFSIRQFKFPNILLHLNSR